MGAAKEEGRVGHLAAVEERGIFEGKKEVHRGGKPGTRELIHVGENAQTSSSGSENVRKTRRGRPQPKEDAGTRLWNKCRGESQTGEGILSKVLRTFEPSVSIIKGAQSTQQQNSLNWENTFKLNEQLGSLEKKEWASAVNTILLHR